MENGLTPASIYKNENNIALIFDTIKIDFFNYVSVKIRVKGKGLCYNKSSAGKLLNQLI